LLGAGHAAVAAGQYAPRSLAERADVAWAAKRLAVLRDLFSSGGKMTAYL
jgi:hypothetical protein